MKRAPTLSSITLAIAALGGIAILEPTHTLITEAVAAESSGAATTPPPWGSGGSVGDAVSWLNTASAEAFLSLSPTVLSSDTVTSALNSSNLSSSFSKNMSNYLTTLGNSAMWSPLGSNNPLKPLPASVLSSTAMQQALINTAPAAVTPIAMSLSAAQVSAVAQGLSTNQNGGSVLSIIVGTLAANATNSQQALSSLQAISDSAMQQALISTTQTGSVAQITSNLSAAQVSAVVQGLSTNKKGGSVLSTMLSTLVNNAAENGSDQSLSSLRAIPPSVCSSTAMQNALIYNTIGNSLPQIASNLTPDQLGAVVQGLSTNQNGGSALSTMLSTLAYDASNGNQQALKSLQAIPPSVLQSSVTKEAMTSMTSTEISMLTQAVGRDPSAAASTGTVQETPVASPLQELVDAPSPTKPAAGFDGLPEPPPAASPSTNNGPKDGAISDFKVK